MKNEKNRKVNNNLDLKTISDVSGWCPDCGYRVLYFYWENNTIINIECQKCHHNFELASNKKSLNLFTNIYHFIFKYIKIICLFLGLIILFP